MFTIRGLLAGVALVAAGCASVAYPSDAWLLLLRGSFCIGILSCILALFYWRGERQAFCAGFLLFGVTFALAAWHLHYVDVRDVLPFVLRAAVNEGDAYRARAKFEGRTIIRTNQYNVGRAISGYQRSVKMSSRADVANGFAVWIVAVVGGRLGVHLFRTRDSLASIPTG